MIPKNFHAVNTMIIPAAGYGTRMHSLTKGNSKEIFEIGGKPALMFALQEAVEADINRVGIVIRKGKEDIIRTIQTDYRLSYIRKRIMFKFFFQSKLNGEAGAIFTASDWLGDRPFLVYYPDNIILSRTGVLSELIRRQSEIGRDLVLLTPMLNHAQAAPCGLDKLEDDLYLLKSDETPPEFPFGLRPTGIYIALPHFLNSCSDLLSNNSEGEIKDRDVRSHMMATGKKILGLNCFANVFDIGNLNGYQIASNSLIGS